MRLSSERVFSGPQARAEPLEDLRRPLQRLAGGALVLRPALDGPEREKRAGELEGFTPCGGVGLNGRRLERRDRPLAVTPRRKEEPAAASGERAEGRVSRRCALDRVSASSRSAPRRSPVREQSLDPDRARQLGEVLVELLDIRREAAPPAASSHAASS